MPSSLSPDEPLPISDWVVMYRDQTSQQATLVVPSWAKHRLDVMSPGMRQSIMEELEQIASQHGLITPVIIVEADDV